MEENNTHPSTQTAAADVTITTSADNMQLAVKPVADTADTQKSLDNAEPEVQTEETQQLIDTVKEQENAIKDDLQTRGIDFDALASEFDKNGELSADSLAKLEKAGYPKPVVDAYINSMNANAEKFVNAVKDIAGGEQGYQQLVQFISQTQDAATINAFNNAIQSADLGQIKLAVTGLQALMQAKYGTTNPTIMAHSVAGRPVGYQSQQELIKDMSDKRYQTDPKFTNEVVQKLKYSRLFE